MTFNFHGIRLSFLQEFIEQCGGKEKISHLSTNDICREIVKPATIDMQWSYCDLLQFMYHPGFGERANVFISHAWQYKFIDVVDALFEHFPLQERDSMIVWFDVFCVNQHDLSSKEFDWWNDTFKAAIGQIGYTVMVLAPWDDPLPLTRAWCILELFCTSVTRSKFQIAMSKANRISFLKTMLEFNISAVNEMLARVDAERSQCSNKMDREKIFEVARSVGFPQLNGMIFEQLRDWVISVVVEEKGKSKEKGKEDHDIGLSFALGHLYDGQGKLNLAEENLVNCMNKCISYYGKDHKLTTIVIASVAKIYIRQGLPKKAEQLLINRQNDSTAKFNLATSYCTQGKLQEALSLFEECFEEGKSLHGKTDSSTLAIMNNLSILYRRMGNHERAESISLDCLQLREIYSGKNHPDTLTILYNLGLIYYDKRDYLKAESTLLEARNRLVSTLGEDHNLSLAAIGALASTYSMQGRYDVAEPLLKQSYERKKRVLGENHPDTLDAINSLGLSYSSQELYDKALPLYEECLKLRKMILGEYHTETLTSMANLGLLYFQLSENLKNNKDVLPQQKNYNDEDYINRSVSLLLETLEKCRQTLGEDHPKTLLIEKNFNGILERL